MRYYLIRSITVGTQRPKAGTLLDDASTNLAPYRAEGAVLWPSTDANVAAAAARCKALRPNLVDEATLDAVMLSGALTTLSSGGVGNPAWATQAYWVVDQLNVGGANLPGDGANVAGGASDNNSGLPGSPLLTLAELGRRLNAVATLGRFNIVQNVTVSVISTNANPDADPFPIIPVRKVGLGTINVVYPLVTVRSGTFTSVTARAAGQQQNVSDSGVASWTADVGRIVTDAVSNARFRVFKDHGGGTAETTEPLLALTTTPPTTTDAGTFPALTQPVATHAYTVSAPSRVRLQGLDTSMISAPGNASNTFAWTFRNASFAVDSSSLQNAESVRIIGDGSHGSPYAGAGFFECTFEGEVEFTRCIAMAVNCWFAQPPFVHLATLTLRGGGCPNTVNSILGSGSQIVVDGYWLASAKLGDQNSYLPTTYAVVSVTAATTCLNLFSGTVSGTRCQLQAPGGHYTPGACGTVSQYWIRMSKGAQATLPAGVTWSSFFQGAPGGLGFALLDGSTKAPNWLASTQTWDATGPVTINLANLDAPNGAGAFGGVCQQLPGATLLSNAAI
jgi:hypothetical protein